MIILYVYIYIYIHIYIYIYMRDVSPGGPTGIYVSFVPFPAPKIAAVVLNIWQHPNPTNPFRRGPVAHYYYY